MIRLSAVVLLSVLSAVLPSACSRETTTHEGRARQGQAHEKQAPEVVEPLRAGLEIEPVLAAGATHLYPVDLTAGDVVDVRVEQLGTDVVLRLRDPEGAVLLETDRPVGEVGRERLEAVAERTGRHRLEVEAFPDQPAAPYRLTVLALHPADPVERRRAEAARRMAGIAADLARGTFDGVRERCHALTATWRELDDPFGEAEAAFCVAQLSSGEAAVPWLESARRGFAASGDHAAAGLAAIQQATALAEAERLDDAVVVFREARGLFAAAGSRRGEAHAIHLQGPLLRQLGRPQEALDAYDRALELWQALDDRPQEARTRSDRGVLLIELAQRHAALDELRRARALWRELREPTGEAVALDQIGRIHRQEKRLREAFLAYREALWLQRAAGDEAGQGVSLLNLGVLLHRQGKLDRAGEMYRLAGERFHGAGSAADEAQTLLHLGALRREQGQPHEALEPQTRALEIHRRLGSPRGEARSLTALAQTERALGLLVEALGRVERALELYETLRLRLASPPLRAGLFTEAQGVFGLQIDLLMELHREQPEAGWAARAFEAGETARARSLLDLVTREEGEPEAGEPETEPGFQPGTVPLSLAELREQALDDDVLLLQVWLGVPRSYLWTVTRDDLEAHELPSAKELRPLAREAHRLLARSARRESRAAVRETLCRLSKAVLGPAAARLGDRRLLVVAQGDLLLLPFSALPDPRMHPCSEAPPLIARHEVVHLPSISTLAALRRRHARRPPPKGALAVIADPVFSSDDPRVRGSGERTEKASAEEPGAEIPRRLPFTRIEADRILATVEAAVETEIAGVAGEGRTLRIEGFEATRDAVLSGRLSGYRILHFATHGLLHPEQPERSGVVLSRVDEAGRPRDGFLRLQEIRNLSLPADLVVLSACRTGIGPEVRGEGLLGLPRGFFDAGAQGVLVSLWPVADRPTALLMERFYEAMFVGGLSPAAALRQAQLAMSRDPAWQAPYHWAGFVLQGDPRLNKTR